MTTFIDSQNRIVKFGKELGRGGEGAIFDLPDLGHNFVAKIYHKPINTEKQMKLQDMARGIDDSIKKIAAWPIETLRSRDTGKVQGFLMPKISDYEPLHNLYNPKQRKQRFPDKDWAFLVSTARNVASAFETIHKHGHVIGDVNENLVLFSRDSTVKLIDCDSFQISNGSKEYLCEVCSPHFTPPEMQNNSSFVGIRRTKNHDNFGLAVLIFHILLMGRHPFSGIFNGHKDISLEESIAQCFYVFGSDAASKKISPPPNSITPMVLPKTIIEHFECAFNIQGIFRESRPSAFTWVKNLDLLKSQLRCCDIEPSHKYYNALTRCPWCDQEQKFGVYSFISVTPIISINNSFDINQIWARILSVGPPEPPLQVYPDIIKVQPMPLPDEVKASRTKSYITVIFWIITVTTCFIYIDAIIINIIIAIIAVCNCNGLNSSYNQEKMKRQKNLELASKNFTIVQSRWNQHLRNEKFHNKLKDLSNLIAEYKDLPDKRNREKLKLERNLQQDQLRKYLDNIYISDYKINGIGPSREATLLSFGIETAYDINYNTIMRIPGFGQVITNELINWRKTKEKKFIFNPRLGVDPADVAVLNQRLDKERKQIETSLMSAPGQLNQIKKEILQERNIIFAELKQAAQNLEHAKSNMSLFN
jgi:DNA-binding helix-hairpin-helix protein with protein kinase domain